jgi:DNA-directed RNA polymerase alpha subunit
MIEMLPDDERTQDMIFEQADSGMGVAELEYLGVSQRVINTLEDKMGIVYLQQLIEMSRETLLAVRQLGRGGVQEIMEAFKRFPELELTRQRWHKGSDKTEYYKKRVNTRAILA